MSDKNDNGIFDEFDFMYRHKEILQKREEERLQKLKEAEEAEAAAKRAAAEAAFQKEAENKPDDKKKVREKKAAKTAVKKKKDTGKKKITVKKTPAADGVKKEKTTKNKVHPDYAKPYKNDSSRDRRRIKEKRKKIEQEYKEEHSAVQIEQERINKAASSARRRDRIVRFYIYLLISVALGALIFALSYFAVFMIMKSSNKQSHKNVNYQVGASANATRLPYDSVIRDNVVYIRGNDLVKLCNFTVTGKDGTIKYISSDKGNDTVEFIADSTKAVVNKNDVRLSAKTYYEDGILYIPMDFFIDYSTGLVCEYKPEDEENRAKITVYKKILNEFEYKTAKAEAIYEPVSFRIKESASLEPIEETIPESELEKAVYKIDITPYEAYINPKMVYSYISVINSDHKTDKTLEYTDLKQISYQAESVAKPIMLREYAAGALEAMLKEVRDVEDLTKFGIYSGYNTYETSTEKDPSTDESLLGLSVEIHFGTRETDFAESRTYQWFEDNAHKFGFIIRYPENKTKQTGVAFKPWVLRYVGRYAATKMHNEKLCLEEFINKYELQRFLQIQ